jgi:hypothetical protein
MDFIISQINKGGKQVQQFVTGESSVNPPKKPLPHIPSSSAATASSLSANNNSSNASSSSYNSTGSSSGANNNNSNIRDNIRHSTVLNTSRESVRMSQMNSKETVRMSRSAINVNSSGNTGVATSPEIPLDLELVSNAISGSSSANNPWNSSKFLMPYVTETRITGYTIDSYPPHFFEPFNLLSTRKQSFEEGPLELGNLDQQISHYESMISTYGAHNFPISLLSSLVSLFGNSPNMKVQEQLISIFKQVAPVKSSGLNLEFWSVMNIVYKNADSYSLEHLLDFCSLSRYFDPTVPLPATSRNLSSSSPSTPQSPSSLPPSPTKKQEQFMIDADVLNLSFGVCLRMCERYSYEQVSYCWSLLIKILYKNSNLLKLNQHWDNIIHLFSGANASKNNKLEFGSFVKMLVPHHLSYLTQQVIMNHEKTPNSNSAVYVELPVHLYIELCMILTNVNPELAHYGLHYIEKHFITYCEKLKSEKDVENILLLPRIYKIILEYLLVSVRSTPSDDEKQLMYIYSLLCKLVALLSGNNMFEHFLIETIDNVEHISSLNAHIISLFEEFALLFNNNAEHQEKVDHCVKMIKEKGDPLRASRKG